MPTTPAQNAAIDRLRRRYLYAFGRVMMKERDISIDILLSGLMAAYGELIAKCSNAGAAVDTIKGMATAMVIFAETNVDELEKLAATNKPRSH